MKYHIAGRELPPVQAPYDYVMAGNGVFVRGRRSGLEVCLPISEADVRGLPDVQPYARLLYPQRVPRSFLSFILQRSRKECTESPLEILFYLRWEEERWKLTVPEQVQTPASCRPVHDGIDSSYELSAIELHSHHGMAARFSSTDDDDEVGFKIYAVLGKIFTRPEIRVRVGLYGYFWEIPADTIFELPDLPEEVIDAKYSRS